MTLYTYAKVARRPFGSILDVIMDNQKTPSFTIQSVGVLGPTKRTVKYHNQPVALIEDGGFVVNSISYLITINPGIDPSLIICLTAICDKMEEQTIM